MDDICESKRTKVTDTREQAPAFHGVFTAKTALEMEVVYDKWAETYDHTVKYDLAGDGENHPTTELIKTLAELLPADTDVQHVFDCGVGTGDAGPMLLEQYPGLQSLVAFDLSSGMLQKAKARKCYTLCVKGCCPDMTGASAACTSATKLYDLVFCAGTFTPNHAPPSTLEQLVQLVKKGGHIAFSIRSYFYEDESSGFKAAQRSLEENGKWTLVGSQERPYLPKEKVLAHYFVYQRC